MKRGIKVYTYSKYKIHSLFWHIANSPSAHTGMRALLFTARAIQMDISSDNNFMIAHYLCVYHNAPWTCRERGTQNAHPIQNQISLAFKLLSYGCASVQCTRQSCRRIRRPQSDRMTILRFRFDENNVTRNCISIAKERGYANTHSGAWPIDVIQSKPPLHPAQGVHNGKRISGE